MCVENEAPMKDTLERYGSVSQEAGSGEELLGVDTHASSTTPIRNVKAVPNRPMNQVAIGDTSRASQTLLVRITGIISWL